MSQKTVLVTGGAGYIGSHTTLSLAEAGFKVVIVDNLCNSNVLVLERLRELAGSKADLISFHQVRCELLLSFASFVSSKSVSLGTPQVDLIDKEGLEKVFSSHKCVCTRRIPRADAVAAGH